MSRLEKAVLKGLTKGEPASISDIADNLSQIRSSSFVTLLAETEPKLPKKSPHYGRLKKQTFYKGLVNFDYEKGVNTRLAKEGKDKNFVSGPNWMRPIHREDNTKTPLCRHKDRQEPEYLMLQVHSTDSQSIYY